MSTQTQPEQQNVKRSKTTREVDYDMICQSNEDRLPFMENFMQTVVTDAMKQTARSYHRKSKSDHWNTAYLWY